MTNNVIWAKIKTPTCRQVQTQNYVTNSQTLMQSAMSDNCGILTYKKSINAHRINSLCIFNDRAVKARIGKESNNIFSYLLIENVNRLP